MNNISVTIPVPPAAPATSADGGATAGAEATPPPPFWQLDYQPPRADVLPDKSAALMLSHLSSGMPRIELPTQCSTDTASAILAMLMSGDDELQAKVAGGNIGRNKKVLEDHHAEAMKKIDDWIKQCKRASKQGCGALGWLKRIAMPLATVGAAVATAATLGAASPLLAMTIAMTAYSLAQIATEEAGGPSIGLADNVNKGLQAAGMDAATASLTTGLIGTVALGGLVVLDPSFAGQLTGGAADAGGADEQTTAILQATATAVASIAVALASMDLSTTGAAATKAAQAGVKAGLKGAAKGAAKAGDDVAKAGEQGGLAALEAGANNAVAAAKEASTLSRIGLNAGRMGFVSQLTASGGGMARGVEEQAKAQATRDQQHAALALEENELKRQTVQNEIRQDEDMARKFTETRSELFKTVSRTLKSFEETNLLIFSNRTNSA